MEVRDLVWGWGSDSMTIDSYTVHDLRLDPVYVSFHGKGRLIEEKKKVWCLVCARTPKR